MLRKVFWNIPNSTQPDDIKWKEDILPAAHIHQSASSFLVTMVWEKLKKTTYTPSSPSINDNIWLRVARFRYCRWFYQFFLLLEKQRTKFPPFARLDLFLKGRLPRP